MIISKTSAENMSMKKKQEFFQECSTIPTAVYTHNSQENFIKHIDWINFLLNVSSINILEEVEWKWIKELDSC